MAVAGFHEPYIGLGRMTKRSPNAASASGGALRSDWSPPGKSRMLSPTHMHDLERRQLPAPRCPPRRRPSAAPWRPCRGSGRSSSRSKGTPSARRLASVSARIDLVAVGDQRDAAAEAVHAFEERRRRRAARVAARRSDPLLPGALVEGAADGLEVDLVLEVGEHRLVDVERHRPGAGLPAGDELVEPPACQRVGLRGEGAVLRRVAHPARRRRRGGPWRRPRPRPPVVRSGPAR